MTRGWRGVPFAYRVEETYGSDMYFVFELRVAGSELHGERQGYHAPSREMANARIVEYLRALFTGVRPDARARFLGAWPSKEAYEQSPDEPPRLRPPARAQHAPRLRRTG